MSIRLVTESSRDIPAHVAYGPGIAVAPLNVHFDALVFGALVFKDDVTITPRSVLLTGRLKQTRMRASRAMASPAAWVSHVELVS